MDVRDCRTVHRLPSSISRSFAERRPGSIGHITFRGKCAGARSAGKPHAACDVAGAGNGLTVRLVRHSHRKRGETDRPRLRSTAPALDPTALLRTAFLRGRCRHRSGSGRSRAAHTDIMDNCEQVFDELVVWRQSAQRDPRGPIQSEDRSNMSPDPMYWFNRVFVPALKRRVFMVGNLPDILYDAVTPFLGSTADGVLCQNSAL